MTVSWACPEPPDLHDCTHRRGGPHPRHRDDPAITVATGSRRRAPGIRAGRHAHEAGWPHVFGSPGVLLLRDNSLQSSRASVLRQQQRIDDYLAEFVFNHDAKPPSVRLGTTRLVTAGWPVLRAPLINEAMTAEPPPRPAGWPAHLSSIRA